MKGLFFLFVAITVLPLHAQQAYKNITESPSGYIGIGTSTPDNLLTVNGSIHTREVLVDLDGAVAPDYVFDFYFDGFSTLKKDYRLPSLYSLEEYLRTHRHHTKIPSATTIEQEGLALKEMNLLLLEKIEELTLYTIAQQKQIDALKTELAALKKEQVAHE